MTCFLLQCTEGLNPITGRPNDQSQGRGTGGLEQASPPRRKGTRTTRTPQSYYCYKGYTSCSAYCDTWQCTCLRPSMIINISLFHYSHPRARMIKKKIFFKHLELEIGYASLLREYFGEFHEFYFTVNSFLFAHRKSQNEYTIFYK